MRAPARSSVSLRKGTAPWVQCYGGLGPEGDLVQGRDIVGTGWRERAGEVLQAGGMAGAEAGRLQSA